jgi:hypothetical protein
MRTKWRNLVLDCFICDAYLNRYTQQKQAWKIYHAYTINNHHNTIRSEQTLSLRSLHNLSWVYPLPMFFLPWQLIPAMELSQITKPQKGYNNRHHHPIP